MFTFAGQSNMVGYRARLDEAQAIDPMLGAPSINIWSFTSGGFGPEQAASRLLSQHGPISIVKFAVSGTNLYRQWSPATRGALYDQLLERVRNATLALAQQGLAGSVKALFWMQGESDTDTLAHANAYAANLERFVKSLRKDLDAPEARFFEGQIANAEAFTALVREQQRIAARKIPHTVDVPTDDLQRCEWDPLHLSTRGTIDLGRRFAQAYLEF